MVRENFSFRRSSERLPCSLIGSYASSRKVTHLVRYIDIGSKGAGIETLKPLQINSYFKLEVNSKNMGVVTLEGKVCWCQKKPQGWRSGIFFDKALSFDLEKFAQ